MKLVNINKIYNTNGISLHVLKDVNIDFQKNNSK